MTDIPDDIMAAARDCATRLEIDGFTGAAECIGLFILAERERWVRTGRAPLRMDGTPTTLEAMDAEMGPR